MKFCSRAFTWPHGRWQQVRLLFRVSPLALVLVFLAYAVFTWPEAERQRGRLAAELAALPAVDGSTVLTSDTGSEPGHARGSTYYRTDALDDAVESHYSAVLTQRRYHFVSRRRTATELIDCYTSDDFVALLTISENGRRDWAYVIALSWGYGPCEN